MPQVRREDRKGHASCVSGEVCANSVISKIKKLKKTLDTAGVVRDGRLCRQPGNNPESHKLSGQGPSMRRPVDVKVTFAFFFLSVCSHSAKPPLSPSFHSHSF